MYNAAWQEVARSKTLLAGSAVSTLFTQCSDIRHRYFGDKRRTNLARTVVGSSEWDSSTLLCSNLFHSPLAETSYEGCYEAEVASPNDIAERSPTNSRGLTAFSWVIAVESVEATVEAPRDLWCLVWAPNRPGVTGTGLCGCVVGSLQSQLTPKTAPRPLAWGVASNAFGAGLIP